MLYLDYLRFLAILGVIAFHVHDTITYDSSWFSGGYLGVDIFLFLSGYFIELSLQKLREVGFGTATWNFFSRRLLRIMAPMLVITWIVAVFAYFQGLDSWTPALYASGFFYNFYLILHHIPYFQIYAQPHPFIGMWFISLLVQVYIAHFVLQRLLRPRWLYGAVLVLLFFATTATTAWLLSKGQENAAYVLPWHAFSYIAGVLTMLFLGTPGERKKSVFYDFVVLLLVLALLGLMIFSPYRNYVIFSLATLLVTFLLLVTAPSARLLTASRWWVVGILGEMSYSLYLWNVPVIAFLHYFYPHSPALIAIVLAVLLILLLSLLSYRTIEVPVRQFFGKVGRHDDGGIPYLSAILLLAIAAGGWYQAMAMHAKSVSLQEQLQHQQLYQDYLQKKLKKLQQHLPARGKIASAATAPTASAEVAWNQWRPNPGAGYLYNGQEFRSNSAYPQKQVLYISDSILLGWSGYVIHLTPNGILDGKVGRSFFRAIPALQQLLSNPDSQDAKYVVVELGSNGYVEWSDLQHFIAAVGNRQIILIIPNVPRPWMPEVKQMYLKAKAEYPNVHLVHWDDISKDHYNYFVADQVHLTWDGAQALMQAVMAELTKLGYREPPAPVALPAKKPSVENTLAATTKSAPAHHAPAVTGAVSSTAATKSSATSPELTSPVSSAVSARHSAASSTPTTSVAASAASPSSAGTPTDSSDSGED